MVEYVGVGSYLLRRTEALHYFCPVCIHANPPVQCVGRRRLALHDETPAPARRAPAVPCAERGRARKALPLFAPNLEGDPTL